MYDINFQYYLADNTDVDIDVIINLFENDKNVFNVALKLIEEYNVDSDYLGKIWADYIGCAYVNPNLSIIHHEYIHTLGKDFILENNVVPLYKLGKAITVTTSDPKNPYIQNKLEKEFGEMVNFVFCFPFDIEICMQFLDFKPQGN